MDHVLMTCQGVAVGPIYLSPFQVRVGDYVCLHLPCAPFSAEEDLVVEVLTGKRPVAGLHLQGRVLKADPSWGQAGLIDFWQRLKWRVTGSPTALAWLCHHGRLTPAEALPRLQQWSINPHWRLNQLARTPKTLLGLEAAWARGAQLVVFTTVGCDPHGVAAARREVSAHLAHGAALELSYPFSQAGQLGYDCHPRANCFLAGFGSPSPADLTTMEGKK